MVLIVLKSSRPVNDPFIALETKLDKAVFSFQIALVATINIFSSIDNINVVKLKDF